MQVKPIKKYEKPDYPPEELFVYNPELLRENMPLIWKGKALVAGALIAFTMGGCQKSIPPQTGKQAVVVQQKES
ncbi:MAG: hypothetical protein LWY06_07400, partial [Firmicutes bacterium]|nr:hypothetical protein [Bacillota bacterium]